MAVDQDNKELEGPAWTKPFLKFLIHGALPQDIDEARRIIRRSKGFTIINKQLYKRSISQILQKCIDEEDGKALLLEIHEGICGHQASSHALIAKSFVAGFYWPTAVKNAEEIVKHCSLQVKHMHQRQSSRLYHYPGLSQPGDSTW